MCFSEPINVSQPSRDHAQTYEGISIQSFQAYQQIHPNNNTVEPIVCQSNEDSKSAKLIYYPHFDHSYCKSSPVSSSSEILLEDMEIDPPADELVEEGNKMPPAKVLKWQDYLQRMRLGVRSAPNSPSTSPKIPRGAARKVNNFMVGGVEKSNQKFQTKPQAQAIQSTSSPLLDPLTAVKIQTKTKGPPLKLQEFQDYLAQLENKKHNKEEESSSPTTSDSPTSNSACVLTTNPLTSESVNELPSKPLSKQIEVSSQQSKVTQKPISTSSKTSRKKPPNNAHASNDPRLKGRVRSKVSGNLKPIPPIKWVDRNADHKHLNSDKHPESFAQSTIKSLSRKSSCSKPVVVNEVTGKLQELLSSVSLQQQKVNLKSLKLKF